MAYSEAIPETSFTYVVDLNSNEVAFTDTSLYAESSFWDFGDFSTSTEKNPVHVYSEPGNYILYHEAINSSGSTSIVKVINVHQLYSGIRAGYPYPTTDDRYWVAPSDNNFSSIYWAYFSGGTPEAPIPGPDNTVIYDANGNTNCNFDIPVHTAVVRVASDYTCYLNQNLQPVTFGDASFLGGSFIGNVGSPTIINRNLTFANNFYMQGDTHARGDVYSNPGFGTFKSDGTLTLNGLGFQSVFCNGGILPTTHVDKTTSYQVKVFGDYPIYINGDFIVHDGTFNTHGHDIIEISGGIIPPPPEPTTTTTAAPTTTTTTTAAPTTTTTTTAAPTTTTTTTAAPLIPNYTGIIWDGTNFIIIGNLV